MSKPKPLWKMLRILAHSPLRDRQSGELNIMALLKRRKERKHGRK
jgi:hypothetical protein